MHTSGWQIIIQFRYEYTGVTVKHLWSLTEHIVNDFIYLERIYIIAFTNLQHFNQAYNLTSFSHHLCCVFCMKSGVTVYRRLQTTDI